MGLSQVIVIPTHVRDYMLGLVFTSEQLFVICMQTLTSIHWHGQSNYLVTFRFMFITDFYREDKNSLGSKQVVGKNFPGPMRQHCGASG